MKKLLSRVKKSNKGFTLIELIIVIAIIAVLAAVVAPQYLKYVENSRIATDANAMDEIAHAAEVASVGDGTNVPSDSSFTVTVDASGVATYSPTGTGTLGAAVETVIPHDSYKFKSSSYKGHHALISVANGAGSVGALAANP